MMGPVCSLAAFVTAWLVARREPSHRPIRDALGAALSYSICARLDAHVVVNGVEQSPKLLLFLWATIAIATGWAYMRAWHYRAAEALALLIGIVMFVIAACVDSTWWQFATWGPFVLSSVAGALALQRWVDRMRPKRVRVDGVWRDRYPPHWQRFGIVQRIALILLASDLCMLAFIPWPGVQVWQGRASAIVVTMIQAGWLIQQRRGSRS